jgi:hypothetical protein
MELLLANFWESSFVLIVPRLKAAIASSFHGPNPTRSWRYESHLTLLFFKAPSPCAAYSPYSPRRKLALEDVTTAVTIRGSDLGFGQGLKSTSVYPCRAVRP